MTTRETHRPDTVRLHPDTRSDGTYQRDKHYLTTRITADGRDGFPVVAGRYRLIAARACPWAHRSVIVRRLLGLGPVLSLGLCGPVHDDLSWTFDLDPGGVDPVLGIDRLREAYLARDRRGLRRDRQHETDRRYGGLLLTSAHGITGLECDGCLGG